MKRSLLLCVALLGSAASLPTVAADMGNMKMDGMEGMDGMSMKATVAHGVGVVKAIDAKAGSITLSHGPVAEVHWPAMTMAFKVVDAKLLAGIKVNQKVAFTFRSEGEMNAITELKPAK